MLFQNKQKNPRNLQNATKIFGSILLVSLLTLVACQKDIFAIPSRESHKPFFKNSEQAFNIVQGMLSNYHKDERLIAIDKIGYLQAKDTSYAFVVYRSTRGTSNISIQKTLLSENGDDEGFTSYKCDGSNCDCYVVATIGSGGTVSMSCTCSSCYLIAH